MEIKKTPLFPNFNKHLQKSRIKGTETRKYGDITEKITNLVRLDELIELRRMPMVPMEIVLLVLGITLAVVGKAPQLPQRRLHFDESPKSKTPNSNPKIKN